VYSRLNPEKTLCEGRFHSIFFIYRGKKVSGQNLAEKSSVEGRAPRREGVRGEKVFMEETAVGRTATWREELQGAVFKES
jgi:hypothetical protein